MNKLDRKYLRQAIELAAKGGLEVRPNPLVGCLIVKNGKIIGRGYHRYFGGPHAEIYALREAGRQARGSTVYLSLEPCAHYGKTPPCSEALIKAGVARVVTAMSDPNRLVNGEGLKDLQLAGVKVENGFFTAEAKKLNRFYFQWLNKKLPFVILKMAMTLDGKIATVTGDSKWVSGQEARRFVWKLRSRVNGIMVGTNTALIDNPRLTSHNLGRDPQRIILDPKLKIPPESQVFNQPGRTIVVTARDYSSSKAKLLTDKGIEIIALPLNQAGQLNFKPVLKELGKRAIKTLLIEGGGETSALALEKNIVDKIIWVIAPKIVGGREAKTPVEGRGILAMNKAIKVENWRIRKLGGDILVEGYIGN
ncbi:MAG: bifunctional diaminohydroxyphosphoribosylaminopyrimidine deaminase/5-amino-6-(5-phosphoribosylamino)uracil reductase RibD [Elusimicrobiota bacterium]